MTWTEAVEFCRRLTASERGAGSIPDGFAFRLPTEAEWEYAARAGTAMPFYYGDDAKGVRMPEHAWHFISGETHNVGGLALNPFGLADLYGNVAEWCSDFAGLYSGGPEVEPSGHLDSAYRIVRGGGFSDDPEYLRSATRWAYLAPDSRLANVGFRVVLAPAAPLPAPPIELIRIPAGTFLMGSASTEPGPSSDEGPQTPVTLTREYFIGKSEVTQGQYLDVVGRNPSHFAGPLNRPVEQVDWYEASEFCRRLTEREASAGRLPEGYVYRLPTEAEWEYAVRAGTVTSYGFGEDAGHVLLEEYACFLTGPTSGAGARRPNPWGLHHAHGNVQEWCLDEYAPYPGTPVSDPVGRLPGSLHKVTRSGSWGDTWAGCRSASRRAVQPDTRHGGVGFRVVLAQ